METDEREQEKEKAKLAWIRMNKQRLDEIERNKRRDFRLCIILQLVSIVLSLAIFYFLCYA